MKTNLLALATVLTIALGSCVSTTRVQTHGKLPSGAIQVGSLANSKLIKDTTVDVFRKLMADGHDMTGEHKIVSYVMAMPSGPTGARVWTEHWYVQVGQDWLPVTIDFKELGGAEAGWEIRK